MPAGVLAGSKDTAGDLAKVQEQIRRLESRKQQDLAKRKDLNADLRGAEQALADQRRQLAETRRQLAEARRKLAGLRREEEQARQELEKQRQLLAAELRLAHRTGGQEQARLLFTESDPLQLGRELTWLDFLARKRNELMSSVQATLASLAEARQAVAQQERELASLEGTRRQQLAALEKGRADRAAVIAELDRRMKSSNRELARAQEQARSLTRLMRELERAARASQDRKPAAPPSGRPLGKGRWPVAGSLLADFGQPRAGGQLRWDGVLIAAPAGTEVRAVRAGKVVYADWLPGLGLLLVLDHGGGYLSLYGHAQDLTRKVGDRAAGGEVIAHVGDSGGQPRPALYFEVRRNGRPENPRKWVN